MSNQVNKTPAARMTCEKENCEKSYVNRGSYKNHMRIHHQSNELIESPLGNFPPMTLFTESIGPAVQGNSNGDVNFPAVISEALFVCQICEKEHNKKEYLTEHIKNQHGSENRELVEAQEDAEDAMIAKELEDMVEKVKFLYEKDCHECDMRKEIEAHKEIELNKKDLTIEMLARKITAIEKKKNELIKELSKTKTNENNLKVVNTDLKEYIKQKEIEVQGLEEALGVEDNDNNEVQEILQETSPENVTMNKETNVHDCNACDKRFRASSHLENHMNAKHNEKTCIYCDNVLINEIELIKHHKECVDIGLANKICLKCNQEFTRNGLKRHTASCQGQDKDFDCPECGELFKTTIGLKKHQDNNHKMQQVKSRVVCKHWRKGNCVKGDLCGFSHVGHQGNSRSATTAERSTRVPACKNGPTCEWLQKGSCSYFHPNVGVQKPWVRKDFRLAGGQASRQEALGQSGRQGGLQNARNNKANQIQQNRQRTVQPDREQCKFDGRCERIPNCPFIHSLEDFPILQRRTNHVERRNPNQKKK